MERTPSGAGVGFHAFVCRRVGFPVLPGRRVTSIRARLSGLTEPALGNAASMGAGDEDAHEAVLPRVPSDQEEHEVLIRPTACT
jgi:hypothetical protein